MGFILGINAFHGDSSACLISEGIMVAAAEEERFRRVKHWAGFPSEAIKYCLEEAGIDLAYVDHIGINQDSKANLWKKISFALVKRPDLGMVLNRVKNRRERTNVEELLEANVAAGFRGEVHEIEHHYAHLSSAFHVSPFDEAVVVSVDGFGDFASAAWGVGRSQNIDIEGRVYFPHSLGIFYQALTQWLGFPKYGDEYKVMGLSSYGEPKLLNKMSQIVHSQDDGSFELNLDFFRHHKEKIDYEWENGEPKVGILYSDALIELLGSARLETEEISQRHSDIARTVQTIYEGALFHLLRELHKKHASDSLCLAGGCAMNSVANGKVYQNTPFKRLYIPPAAGDAGGAIGAAYSVWHELGSNRDFVMNHAYWGPQFSCEDIDSLLSAHSDALNKRGCEVKRIKEQSSLCKHTALAISDGKVIGWFQGRMEWGPRALGNRSILCDPRRSDMKDILNLKIKRRESFRPFAPSILREDTKDWFEVDDDVPFMMQVYQILKHKQKYIPAVTHIDGSGRLQTIDSASNPLYHELISTFKQLTNIPIILNTSFNENEPIVCNPSEALDCFLRTKMDVLVLGDWYISR